MPAGLTTKSTLAKTDYHQSLTVVAITHAAGLGAHGHASAPSGAPALTLTPTSTGGLLLTGGEDWQTATARTLDASQTMLHEFRDTATGDDYWVTRLTGPTQAGSRSPPAPSRRPPTGGT